MFGWSRLRTGVTFVALVFAYACIAIVDVYSLSAKDAWSGFQRFRIRLHLEAATNASLIVPPISVLAPIHHGGRLLDAYLDKDHPPMYTMNYLRRLVLRSADCQEEAISHEKKVAGGGKKYRTVKCEVPFGYGAQDTFQIRLYAEKVDTKVHTDFLVDGLGLVPSTKNQSPMHLFRSAKGVGALEHVVLRLDHLVTQLRDQNMADEVWINLTSDPDLSRFSDSENRLKPKPWMILVKERNRKGVGVSTEELFKGYR